MTHEEMKLLSELRHQLAHTMLALNDHNAYLEGLGLHPIKLRAAQVNTHLIAESLDDAREMVEKLEHVEVVVSPETSVLISNISSGDRSGLFSLKDPGLDVDLRCDVIDGVEKISLNVVMTKPAVSDVPNPEQKKD